MKILKKLTSRKLWIAIAAFLASLGAGLAGIVDPTVCTICCVASAAIYAACEAYVDGKSAQAPTITTTITASTSSKETVERLLDNEQ